jgi:type II secretory pathway component PulF
MGKRADMSRVERRSCSGVLLRTTATLCVHFVAFATVLFVLGSIVPGYRQCFERLDVDLPRLTVPVFHLSDAVVAYWHTLVLAAIMFDPLLVVLLTYSPRIGNWLAPFWNTLILLSAVVILFVTTLALYLPLRGLPLESLSL